MNKINDELQKLYKNKCCAICGSTTGLNIEGYIHHHAKIVCLDRKACQKRRKKCQ